MKTSSVNNSVFMGFFEKQKLTGPNFIDWYRQPRIVLSIEDKLNYLKHPIPPAPVAPGGHLEEGQSVSSYVLKIKSNIDNRECLRHPVTLGLGVSLILNSLRKEFNGFVQNYNMHGMGKTINELHAMLKLHGQTLPKNNATPLQAIRAGKWKNKLTYAPKPKIPHPPKREDHAKDSVCHQCRDTCHWKRNCPQYLVELLKNKKLSQGASSSVLYTLSNKRAKSNLDSASYDIVVLDTLARNALRSCNMMDFSIQLTLGLFQNAFLVCLERWGEYMSQEFLDHLKDHEIIAHRTPFYMPQHNAARILNMIQTKKVEKTPCEVWHGQAPKLSYIKVWGYEALVKRDTLTKPNKLEPRFIKCIFVGYPKETIGYSLHYIPKNKVLVARNAEFLENSLITQEASGSLEDLEIIQEEDTHLSIYTSLNHKEDDLETDEPQSDIIPIRRSTRTRHASDHLCLYIDAEEHKLGDLGEPANYKVALLDPDKWLFKKKTDMDGVVHTYKARLMAKGYIQALKIDYEETFYLIADIRAIRILIAIAAFYDYEIWQMNVKTAFLNEYLFKEVYMEQPKGNNILMLQDVKSYIGLCFAMKDLGEAAYIIGIKIYRDRSRRIPIQDKLRLSKSQCASTPAELKCMQNVPYASAMGSIMYDVRCTLPDIAFAQNITSRLQQNSGDLHWTTVKNIMKYLRNTKDIFLAYREAEYIAAFDASKKAVWVRKFISGLGVVSTSEEPISMYCDSTGAITIANESCITKGARYFRTKVHYFRKVNGDVKLEKVYTYDNLADPFTKALAFSKHSEHTKNI
nr:hypothetical protein [Tanacetum cinerariifolium]